MRQRLEATIPTAARGLPAGVRAVNRPSRGSELLDHRFSGSVLRGRRSGLRVCPQAATLAMLGALSQ